MPKSPTILCKMSVAILSAPMLVLALTGCGEQSTAAPKAGSATPTGKTVEGPEWLADYAAALALSKSTGKPILADFTGSDWCGWCIKLKEEVFETKEFATWAAANVVLLEVDFPNEKPQTDSLRQQNAGLAEKFRVETYPSILLIDSSGSKIGQTGYVPGGPAAWIETANKALGK